ncbi:MAG: hypothetical protein CMJ46_14570 [Planctomyces sp.]|nr:hypothetical protein [Planctomyces sp.]
MLLPHDLSQPENARHLPAILAHEFSHARSYDVFWNRVIHVLQILLWFHPLVWKLGDTHQRDCERVCDAVATTYINDVQSYSRTLATIALRATSRPLLGTVSMARTCDVRQRIAKLHQQVFAHSIPILILSGMTIASLTAAVLLTGCELTETEIEAEEVEVEVENDAEEKPSYPVIQVTSVSGESIQRGIVRVVGSDREGHAFEETFLIENGRVRLELRETEIQNVTFIVETPNHLQFHYRISPEVNHQFIEFQDNYEFRLHPATTIGGVVVDETGKPMPGVKLRCGTTGIKVTDLSGHYGSNEVITDSEGRWECAQLRADLEGLAFTIDHPTHVNPLVTGEYSKSYLVPPESYASLKAKTYELQLKEAPILEGVVSDPAGNPLTGVMVLRDGQNFYTAYGRDRNDIPVTDENGKFIIRGLEQKSYKVTFYSTDWGLKTIEAKVPSDAPLQVTLQKGQRLEIRATNPAGKPIAHARVFPGAPQGLRGEEYSGLNHYHALSFLVNRSLLGGRTDENGLFVWENAPPEKLQYRILATGYCGQGNDANFSPADSPVETTLHRVIPVFATVVDDATGEPIADFKIYSGYRFKMNPKEMWGWNSMDRNDAITWKSGIPADTIAAEKLKTPLEPNEFRTHLSSLDKVYRYRVQAPGYLPVLSEQLDRGALPAEPVELTFRLKKMETTVRIVQTPEGQPVANADVVIAVADSRGDNPMFVFMDRTPTHGHAYQFKTNAEGAFDLPQLDDRYVTVIMHDDGIQYLDDLELLQRERITLDPWVSYSGNVLFDDPPQHTVLLAVSFENDAYGTHFRAEDGTPRVYYHERAVVDSSGHFELQHGIPGALQYSLMGVKENRTNLRETQIYWRTDYRYDPDKSVEETPLVLGDNEVDVIGEVKIPDDVKLDFDNSGVEFKLTGIAGDDWKTYRCEGSANLKPDGTFRVHKLRPGHYKGYLRAGGAEDPILNFGQGQRRDRYEVELEITPETFAGKGPGNPIDLGEIILTPDRPEGVGETKPPVVEEEAVAENEPNKNEAASTVDGVTVVKLVDEDGKPIPDGVVTFIGDQETGKHVKVDLPVVQGMARFEHGGESFKDLSVKIVSRGHQVYNENWKPTPGEETFSAKPQYEIELKPAITIGGKAVDEQGEPLANVLIRCEAGFRYRDEEKRSYDATDGWVRSGADGQWKAHDLPPDLKGLSFRVEHLTHEFKPAAEDNYFSYTVPPEQYDALRNQKYVMNMTEAIPLTGVVTSPEGEPIEGVEVEISGRTGNWERILAQGMKFKTNARGEFRLPNPPRGGQYVRFEHPDWRPRRENIGIPHAEPLKIELESGKRVEFQVVDEDGNPLEGARFFVDGENFETDSEGKWVWTNVPEGKLNPQISKKGYLAPDYREGYDAADSPIVIALHKSIPVAVKLLDAKTGDAIQDYKVYDGYYLKGNRPGTWMFHPHYLGQRNAERGPLPAGGFTRNIGGLGQKYRYRVEAEGYLPVMTDAIEPTEWIGKEINWTFRLEKQRPLERVVLQPDGAIAANAEVIVKYLRDGGDGDLSATIFDTQGVEAPSRNLEDQQTFRTDTSGKFTMPAMDRAYMCLIRHASGYLPLYFDVELIQQEELKLRPWMEFSGKVVHGAEPASGIVINGSVAVDTVFDNGFLSGLGWDMPSVKFIRQVKTNSQGEFTLSRLPQGVVEVTLSAETKSPDESPDWTSTTFYDPENPDHNPLVIGDDEVDIRGRIDLPDGFDLARSESSLSIHEVYQHDNPGREPRYRATTRLEADGTFLLRNVPPGHYNGSAQFSDKRDIVEGIVRTPRRWISFELKPEMFEGKGPGTPLDWER